MSRILSLIGTNVLPSLKINNKGVNSFYIAYVEDNPADGDGLTLPQGSIVVQKNDNDFKLFIKNGDDPQNWQQLLILSDLSPQPLGISSPGISNAVSRADHIHSSPYLNDLSDVSVGSPRNNDILMYDNITSTWFPTSRGAAGSNPLTIYVSPNGSDSNTGFSSLEPMQTLIAAINQYYVRGRPLIILLEAGGTYTTGAGPAPNFGIFSDLVNVTFSSYNAITPETITISAEVQSATDSQVAIVDVTGFARSWTTNELVGSAFIFNNTGRIGWVLRNSATSSGVTQITITSGNNAGSLNSTGVGSTLDFYTDSTGKIRGRHAIIQGPDVNFGFRQCDRISFDWIEFQGPAGLPTPPALILEATQARFDNCFFGDTIQRIGTFLYSNFLWLFNSYIACKVLGSFALITPQGTADTVRLDAGCVLDGINASSRNGIQSGGATTGNNSVLLLQGRVIAQELSTVYNLSTFSANRSGSSALISFVLSNQQGGNAVARVADLQSSDGISFTVLPAIRGSTTSTWAIIAARNSPLVRMDPFFNVVNSNTSDVNRISGDGGLTVCAGDMNLRTRILRDAGLVPLTIVSNTDVNINGISGDAFNIDLSTATGDVTINLTNPVKFKTIILRFQQGLTPRSIISWNGGVSVLWAGGVPGALTAAQGAIDVFELYHDGTQYIGRTFAANIS